MVFLSKLLISIEPRWGPALPHRVRVGHMRRCVTGPSSGNSPDRVLRNRPSPDCLIYRSCAEALLDGLSACRTALHVRDAGLCPIDRRMSSSCCARSPTRCRSFGVAGGWSLGALGRHPLD